MTIENNNLDNLHEIYSRAEDRMSYDDGDVKLFSKAETLECIALELMSIRILLQRLIQ